MDDLDHRLIAQLRHDARASLADLAKRLKVSRGTVSNRLTRLEHEGIITGYTVRLRPDSAPDDICAWACIAVEGNQHAVIRSLLGEPGVAELHDTNGRWDLLAGLQVASLTELSSVLERIRGIPGITATETSVHLKSLRG